MRDLLQERPHDLYREFSERRSAQRRSAHASCWTAGSESDAMWRLYTDRGLGVCFQMTRGSLSQSVEAHKLTVRPIFYRDYHIVDGHGFLDDLDLCMQKCKGYEHEQEVRLLNYGSEHYQARLSNQLTLELRRYIQRPWDTVSVLERIIISPFADVEFERRARKELQAAARVAGFADRIELSPMYRRRFKAID